MTECKETAAKRRRQSTRLENLGIPEEELLRQQQELFARSEDLSKYLLIFPKSMFNKDFILIMCLKGTRGSGTGGAGQKCWTHRGQLELRVLIGGKENIKL